MTKTVNDIRSEFLNFFAKRGHEEVPSSPLVPHNDPSLMFTNSGMVQFKNVFTGIENREYSRAVSAQKCVRAGGKHNDLENVGYTARHHTFFEMLGNFSFGDYFKEEAIRFAWELVSKVFDMPKDRLLITVHSSDEEAAALWTKIAGFSDEKIIRIDTDDNFWMMGDTGPCGPSSEIFYDQGEALEGGPPGSENEDGDRFLEFWNLVFMQFEQEPDGRGGYNRKPLPSPSIDTGMGLERMAALVQGKTSNYDIDLLRDIIEHVADLTGADPDGKDAASHRVIADHLRASAFLMADGVLPSNEGRGYVLRRIMRRGMRHAHILGANEPLLYKLFPTLKSKMAEAYPELRRAEALIKETLRSEEQRFKRTLDQGLKLLEEEVAKVRNKTLPGEVAFKLYDTYGFPLDLTQDALKSRGIKVDTRGFEKAMAEQKKKARAAWRGSGEAATDKLWFEILDEAGPTEFLGYDTGRAEGEIKAIVKEGVRVDELKKGETGIIITNQTPFYGESGGQVGDTGVMRSDENGSELTVTDTGKALQSLLLHYVKCNKEGLKVGDTVKMYINTDRRNAIRANHSATHLMHAALRRVLGEHVTQKGSVVDENRLRFDISHPKAMSEEDIREVEDIVNAEIRANTPVETKLMPLKDARESGAMALFGEKYEDEVRVLTMGREEYAPDAPEKSKVFSIELCGGTHVKRTGDIGLFKIISETALSAGVRRIEALTGEKAFSYLEKQEETLKEAQALLKTGAEDFLQRLENILEERKKLEKETADLRRALATSGAGASSGPAVKEIAGIKFTGQVLEGIPPKDLKPMADEFKKKLGSGVIVLVATNEGKASIVVGVTEDLTSRVSAVDLVRVGSEALGGKGGGGRPDMAQAGGPDAAAANDALSAIEKVLST